MAYLLTALALGDQLDVVTGCARGVTVVLVLTLLVTLASTRLMRRWGRRRGTGRHDG